MRQQTSSGERCTLCGSNDVEYWEELSSWVCGNCSLVLDGKLQLELDKEEVDQRESTDLQEGDSGWRSSVGASDASEEILIETLSTAEEIAGSLSLSSESTIRAGEILVEAWQSRFMHGRTIETTVGAAIYIASRESSEAIPPGVVAEELDLESNLLKDRFKKLKDQIDHSLNPASPEDFTEYLCSALNLDGSVTTTANQIVRDSRGVFGNPVGIAGGGVYVAAERGGFNVTLREIASVTSLTKETVWRQAKKLRSQ